MLPLRFAPPSLHRSSFFFTRHRVLDVKLILHVLPRDCQIISFNRLVLIFMFYSLSVTTEKKWVRKSNFFSLKILCLIVLGTDVALKWIISLGNTTWLWLQINSECSSHSATSYKTKSVKCKFANILNNKIPLEK